MKISPFFDLPIPPPSRDFYFLSPLILTVSLVSTLIKDGDSSDSDSVSGSHSSENQKMLVCEFSNIFSRHFKNLAEKNK